VTLPTVLKIQRVQPDAIVNAIYGTANIEFFEDLRRQGFTPDKTATLSVSITEHEVKAMNPTKLAGDYLAASYFQIVDRPEGKAFAEKMRAKHGRFTIVTDPMGAAYDAVNVWAKTVNQIGTTDPNTVIKAVRGQEFEGPRDRVKIDPDNLYTWLPARIAKIRPDGELDLITGPGLNNRTAPIPYPDTRTPERWSEYLRGLNFKWNGKWQAPHPKVE
jgi:urea transport system substrate-binding protein